jgi:hypothetical protein
MKGNGGLVKYVCATSGCNKVIYTSGKPPHCHKKPMIPVSTYSELVVRKEKKGPEYEEVTLQWESQK